jgi:hypothetical protein
MCLNVTPHRVEVLGLCYCFSLLVRENNKRDSYIPHPIAEERILRERRREAPSKKPAMPRSFNCRYDQTKEEGLKKDTDIPHCQDCPSKATVFVFSANLHSRLPNAVNVQLLPRKGKIEEDLDDIEGMCGKRRDGSGGGARGAMQSR